MSWMSGGEYDEEKNRFDHHQKAEREKERTAFLTRHSGLCGRNTAEKFPARMKWQK